MTKSLTEQWKDGTLEDNVYYVKFYTTTPPHIMIVGTEYLENLKQFNGTDRAEVLAPVPEYHTWKNVREQWKVAIPQIERQNKTIEKLEQQLAIATRALKEIYDCTDWADNAFIYATEALTKMEGVK